MIRSFDRWHWRGLACALALAGATTLASTAGATVLYDATAGAEMGGDVVDPNAPGGVGVGPILADRFFNPVLSKLTSVTLNLALNGAPLSGFTVDLWPDSTGTPGLPVFSMETKIASVSDSSLSSGFKLYTFTPVGGIVLAANTFYDIGIDTGTAAGGAQVTNAIFGNTVDPMVLGRPSVVAVALYFHTVGGIDPNSAGPYEVIVNAAVPEPSTLALIMAGAVGLCSMRYRRVAAR